MVPEGGCDINLGMCSAEPQAKPVSTELPILQTHKSGARQDPACPVGRPFLPVVLVACV